MSSSRLFPSFVHTLLPSDFLAVFFPPPHPVFSRERWWEGEDNGHISFIGSTFQSTRAVCGMFRWAIPPPRRMRMAQVCTQHGDIDCVGCVFCRFSCSVYITVHCCVVVRYSTYVHYAAWHWCAKYTYKVAVITRHHSHITIPTSYKLLKFLLQLLM